MGSYTETVRRLARFLSKEQAMPKNKEGHGIVLDDKGQEQPKDRARAQSETPPGQMPAQKSDKDKDDELQPLREKSGF
jgi:hypothetical protein